MKTQRPTNHQLLIIDRFQSQASEQMPFLEFEMEAEKRYRLQSMTYIIMNVVNLAFRKWDVIDREILPVTTKKPVNNIFLSWY